MSQPDALMARAIKEAAESFNELLQVIICESYTLSRINSLTPEAAARALRISEAARKAVQVNRSIFGQSDPREH